MEWSRMQVRTRSITVVDDGVSTLLPEVASPKEVKRRRWRSETSPRYFRRALFAYQLALHTKSKMVILGTETGGYHFLEFIGVRVGDNVSL